MGSGGVRVQLRVGGKDRVLALSDQQVAAIRRSALAFAREPFTRRTYCELAYFVLGCPLAAFGIVFSLLFLGAGAALAVTFVGVIVIALGVRGARWFGSLQRSLARHLLAEGIEDPDSFVARHGLFAWLQAALRDKTGWKTIGYLGAKALWVLFNVWFAISVWWDVLACLGYPLFGRGNTRPAVYGVIYNLLHPGFFSVGTHGVIHGAFIVATGVVLLFIAPWPMRFAVYVDRKLVHWLLGPDAVAQRMRNLEAARASTVDSSAALLRRIERDLHDGTQAQLVALAMRLGDAKERLEAYPAPELAPVRQLLDEAHRSAKEVIVELRDLARGIHPPALDVGLEGALATLAARSTLPTELVVSITDRPTPAIESIAYFCVAELLANVAQHAEARRATVTCSQTGTWLRLVVRDDGRGGAVIRTGSRSSGLSGLAERVQAVDGRLEVTSPLGGPTVVTVDLPLHA
ncbi:MAG: sensor histidine kinase [Acidimicrobiales bacterium]